MIGGVHGKVLHIDLTTHEQRIELMPEDEKPKDTLR